MDYTKYSFKCEPEIQELLIAELSDTNFESFEESAEYLFAYIPSKSDDFKLHLENFKNTRKIDVEIENIPNQNWNEEWEKQFEPVEVENCLIRADFHEPNQKYAFEVIINPSMSFGTGHHETTSMMVSNMLNQELKNKKVLDVGCGTAVLSILAEKLGANYVLGFDIEENAFRNAIENIARNSCKNVHVFKGDITQVSELFNVVIANINRNTILSQLDNYIHLIQENGYLYLSGFFTSDAEELINISERKGLLLISQKEKNNWSSLVFLKK